MANYIKVSVNNMRNDADKIQELCESIPTLIKEITTALGTLNGCWEGATWNAYQNTNADYVEALTEIHEYYVQYAANVLSASTEYMRAEQDVMDDVDSWSLK